MGSYKRATILTAHIRGLLTPLTTAPEPPSRLLLQCHEKALEVHGKALRLNMRQRIEGSGYPINAPGHEVG